MTFWDYLDKYAVYGFYFWTAFLLLNGMAALVGQAVVEWLHADTARKGGGTPL